MVNNVNAAATKNQIISARILAAVASGMDVRDAIDTVLGAGVSAALISDLYDGLRAGR